jgi:AraC-like DNA-binding protein
MNRRPLRPEYSELILPHSRRQDEATDAETIRGVREHASHRLSLARLARRRGASEISMQAVFTPIAITAS